MAVLAEVVLVEEVVALYQPQREPVEAEVPVLMAVRPQPQHLRVAVVAQPVQVKMGQALPP